MKPAPSYYRPASPVDTLRPAINADLCVYGCTAAGVIAAVHAKQLGLSVVVLNPAWHVGGMTSSGLGFTDAGNVHVIGGLAREFYRRVGAQYGRAEEWRFEPHIAEVVFSGWLKENAVEVLHGQYVIKVDMDGNRIREVHTTSGLRVRSRYCLDCSYEGDLMAAANVPFAVGREDGAIYGEHYNGQQIHATHQFQHAVDPYVREGEPGSGLLQGLSEDSRFIPGMGDRRVQAYNFRVCMTKRSDLRVPFVRPETYDRSQYELLARNLRAGARETFAKFDLVQNGKTDTNNCGAFSTDFVGGNELWPTADYVEREGIFKAHVAYQQGYHWFMAHDDAVPAEQREAYGQWGLCADEFGDSGNWPRQLYVREARRLLGRAVMTEKHCFSLETIDDPVALGAYTMDSHNCRRIVQNGLVLNEGNVELKLPRPYGISLRSLLPRKGSCDNLAVPVCLSASHIAFGSIRMEPVFMILAQSAAALVATAFDAGHAALSEVPYARLKEVLEKHGQILTWDPLRSHDPDEVNPRHEPDEASKREGAQQGVDE